MTIPASVASGTSELGSLISGSPCARPTTPVIPMEYFPAGSVQDRLDNGPPGILLAARWTRDVLEALALAHAEGIVHRDVRPSNLLVDAIEHAVLSDFGVSADGAAFSAASDVWAVGCLLYAMVAGHYPYEGPREAASGGRTPLHRVDIQVPLALSRIVERGLAPDPTERYSDAAAMLRELTSQPIVETWSKVDDPSVEAAWETTTRSGRYYYVAIRAKARAGYRGSASTRGGSRLSSRRDESTSSIAGAKQIARRWLIHVVEGGGL